ncbi:AraC family transcriptional regulator [Nesterenkonia alba]|uniref:AraC family transcriptional regulator n=1 Tax=Nesterenkonia alba TaxID=515814 RepID=UPI001B7FBC0B|nr:AraC family transcriptional regulator [Nesterenkonia alba]
MTITATRSSVWIPSAVLSERVEDDIHVLLWQVRGCTDLMVEGQSYELTAGTARWIPAGLRHGFTVREDSVVVPLFFPRELIATTVQESTTVTVGHDLHSLLLAHMVSSSSQIRPAVNITRQVLALIEQSPIASESLPMPTGAQARRVAEALRFNPGDTRCVAELAASVHVSERTLERAFVAETGSTLREWRIRNRVEAAAVLLRSGAAVDAVAHRVGYTHVNAFRRVFKEHFGVTPTAYRRRYG